MHQLEPQSLPFSVTGINFVIILVAKKTFSSFKAHLHAGPISH
jgi:hypothetical protein